MSYFDKSSRITGADTRATRSFTADMHYMVYTFFCCYSSACRSPPAPMSVMSRTVLPAKSDSDVMFCLQSYYGFIIDISLVYQSYSQDRINTQVIY